jgi:S-methylmethionine-dependent homocysteine/selenocysteine methylase
MHKTKRKQLQSISETFTKLRNGYRNISHFKTMAERPQGRLAALVERQGFAVIDGGLATQLERLGADLNGAIPPPCLRVRV